MNVIEVKDLVKQFPKSGKERGELTAVDHISFSVKDGEVFGLLGPNGAGKTTTFEIIEGLQQATAGTTSVLGFDSHMQAMEVKRRIGIQLQASSFYDHLTLTEMLGLFGSMYGKKPDTDHLLKIVELTEKRDSLIKELSGGQQQRFSIAVALVNDPDVVFLDEPTTGLDPQARRHMWDFIRKINSNGKTVVLTTHSMEEAQELCHRIGIIDHGKIVKLDTPQMLINDLDSTATVAFTLDRYVSPGTFQALEGVERVEEVSKRYRLNVSHASVAMPHLYRWAVKEDAYLHNLEITRATLEDVFLSLTGSSLRE